MYNYLNPQEYNIHRDISMSSLRLTEFPNPSIVERLSRHKWIFDEQRDMYYAYYKCIKDGKAVIQYKGRKQEGTVLGRLYSATPYMLSSCNMWNRARATLFAETEMDIDMVNAHFKLLLAMCKRYREHFADGTYDMLEKYCTNRESMFEDIYVNDMIIDEYNETNNEAKTKKDFLKTLFTIKLYGGSVRTWEKTYGLNNDDYELSEEFSALEFELEYIAKTIVKIHPKAEIARGMYHEKVKKKMKNKLYEDKAEGDVRLKEPKPHKLLAYLLQDKEREVVLNAIKKAQAEGFTVTCYSYDGFQIKKDDAIHRFLEKINDESEGVEFIVKPFRDPLPLDEKYLVEPEPESFNPLAMWRIGLKQVYDEEINKYILQPTKHNDMMKKKEYFEKYFMFVNNQKKIVEELSCGIFNYITPTDSKYFANVEFVNEKGDKVPFINWWLRQMDRRQYDKMECLPPPCHVPKNVYNLWKGFGIEEVEYDETVDTSMIKEHFYNIAGNDETVREYLLNYFAHKIQKPAIKLEVCLILYTHLEGAGKGLFAEELMQSFLGKYETEYFTVIEDIKEINARFNNIPEKILGVVNEVEAKDTFGLVDKLKGFITNKVFNKELKGCTMERGLRALCDLIITTNNDNCMKVSESDRRFVIIECNEEVIGDYEYFGKIWNAYKDKRVIRAFYEELKNRDISNFIPQRDRPRTKIYEEFASSSISPVRSFWGEQFINWKDDGGEPIEKPKLNDMWTKFLKYFERCFPSRSHSYSIKTFSRESRKIDGVWKECQTVRLDNRTHKCIVVEWGKLQSLYDKL